MLEHFQNHKLQHIFMINQMEQQKQKSPGTLD